MPGGKPVRAPTSAKQQRAMFAAASGNSTLGIPQAVGEEKAEATMKKAHGGKLTAKDRGKMESLIGRAKTSAERTGKGIRAAGRRY